MTCSTPVPISRFENDVSCNMHTSFLSTLTQCGTRVYRLCMYLSLNLCTSPVLLLRSLPIGEDADLGKDYLTLIFLV